MRHVARSLFSCVLLGIVAGHGGSARAQEVYSLSDQGGVPSAADYLRHARSARDATRWGEAKAAFEAALLSMDSGWATDAQRAETAGELGLCEIHLGQFRDAAEHLAQGLSQRASLTRLLQNQLDYGRRKVEARVAVLSLKVEPPGAEVFVDGRLLDRRATLSELFLEPGAHSVRARLWGHDDAGETFEVDAAQMKTIALRLAPLFQPAASAPVAPRAPAAHIAAPARPSDAAATLRITGAFATAALVAAGTVLLVRADVVRDDLHERSVGLQAQGWPTYACTRSPGLAECRELQDMKKEADLLRGLGTAAMVTGGAFGLATAVSLLFRDSSSKRNPESSSGVQVVPRAAGAQAGVSLQGAW